MVGCEYPGEGAIYFTIIAGPKQDSNDRICCIFSSHSSLRPANQNFLSQQMESASSLEVKSFIKTKIFKKCIKRRKSGGSRTKKNRENRKYRKMK